VIIYDCVKNIYANYSKIVAARVFIMICSRILVIEDIIFL